MKILVTGGAGYIGSHTVVELAKAGYSPVIVDHFSNSSRQVVDRLKKLTSQDLPVYEADVTNAKKVETILDETQPDAVIHFAAFKAVGESVSKPLSYYYNNIVSTTRLVQAMTARGIRNIVFSSSACVYGDPDKVPITEDMPLRPTNPYGQTKVMCEQILRDAAKAHASLKVTMLRYFNPVGAHESGLIGEDPGSTPNNLVPYISQVAVGRLDKLRIYGNDYDTPDGTGVRDYLHVVDLAKAHVKALERAKESSAVYNLGTGQGNSVLEMVNAFEKASGRPVPYEIAPRRPGDIGTCYADPSRANQDLDWQAEKSVDEMCEDTWRWQSQNPRGYAAA